MGKNILLCTLGTSWAVIPEVYGFLAPERLPLYSNHPQRSELEKMRRDYGLSAPDEIWIYTTQGEQTRKSLINLNDWRNLLVESPVVRIWQAQGTDQLATQQECADMRELILRACLAAQEHLNGGQLLLSLAGGRKTMSADVQWAGSLFGCQALIHVIGTEPLPKELKEAPPELFTAPLPPALCSAVFPLVTGQTARSDYLDISMEGCGPTVTQDFPLPLPDPESLQIWPAPVGAPPPARSDSEATPIGPRASLLRVGWVGAPPPARSDPEVTSDRPEGGPPTPVYRNTVDGPIAFTVRRLSDELKKRETAGSQLLGNYLFAIGQTEHHENWRSLYRLPPRIIEQLRQTPLGPAQREWLQTIPKADLHRHLGGCLDIPAQRAIGLAIWDSLNASERRAALQQVAPLLNSKRWAWSWPKLLKQNGSRSHNIAALLVEASDVQLQKHLFAVTEPRLALKERHNKGFSAYERPGELSGSAVLVHPAAIEPYARHIALQAADDGLAYAELRGSPQKYGDGLAFLRQFHAALQHALASLPIAQKPQFRFIVIADRRNPGMLKQTIDMAVAAKQEMPDFIVGLDVAGDEKKGSPAKIAAHFLPAFAACLPLTIHAGEGEAAESIWQAAYHLHADRIGHGLTIGDHPQLAERFRNRDICLELCPTSNREVVGFHDPDLAESKDCPEYPLQKLWELGLPLTLCTDNPGISRTTLTDEYLTAARMLNGKLSCWDALAMIKQGFVHAFLPGDEKEKVLNQADKEIYRLISQP